MRVIRARVVLAGLAALLLLASLPLGYRWWTWKQWFHIQDRQMATIMQLETHPPIGSSDLAWENIVVTLHNVWGNITYAPNYSDISYDEMRVLQRELESIVAQSDASNSVESVDRIYGMLADRGRKLRFINGYREEFRSYFPDHEFDEQTPSIASPSPSPVPE